MNNYTMTQDDADYLPQFVIDRILEEWDCETFDVALVLEGAFTREYEHILPRAEATYSEAYGAECVALVPIAYDDVEENMDLRLICEDLPWEWATHYADAPVDPETEMTVSEWRVTVHCAIERRDAEYMERATK